MDIVLCICGVVCFGALIFDGYHLHIFNFFAICCIRSVAPQDMVGRESYGQRYGIGASGGGR